MNLVSLRSTVQNLESPVGNGRRSPLFSEVVEFIKNGSTVYLLALHVPLVCFSTEIGNRKDMST